MDKDTKGIVTLKGPGNSYIKVKVQDGRYIQADVLRFPQSFIERDQFQCQEEDIVICSYPKSGLHWVWEIVRMLETGTSQTSSFVLEGSVLDIHLAKALNRMKKPRVYSTHYTASLLPSSIKSSGSKIVHIRRDPRAVAVSGFNHLRSHKEKFHGEWKDFLDFFYSGRIPFNSWFEYTKDWERFIQKECKNPIHIINYEDLYSDPLGEIKRLSEFLGKSYTTDFLSAVARAAQFDALKQSKEKIGEEKVGAAYEGHAYPMFRKGKTDDWKTYFTVEQNDIFIKNFAQLMNGSNVMLKSLM